MLSFEFFLFVIPTDMVIKFPDTVVDDSVGSNVETC